MNQRNPAASAPLDMPLTARAAPGPDGERSIHAVFLRVAASCPNRTALVCDDRRISYGELSGQANRVATALRGRGVRRGDLVGLYMQRSPEAIVAILGILQAGAAYVPFDPSYPHNLLRRIYSDSAPVLMLVDRSQARSACDTQFWDGPTADLLSDLGCDAPWDGAEAGSAVAASDLAYVMYTSGSTGIPKGVLIPHRAVLRLVLNNYFAHLDADETLLQLAPLTFDASTFEIWGALLNGGTLAILSAQHPSLDEIAQAIERHGVTTLWLTAGLFHLMVDHRVDGLKPLRQLLAGGDVLSLSHVRRALAALPGCRLINGYGPTENTTFSCCYTIPHEPPPDGPIPIGVPIAQTEIHILDSAGKPVVDGEAGELYVGGAGLADGYLKRPELTAEKFVADPFAGVSDARLYRTGDQVRRRSDGNLEFLGRADRQVKINGKRVELDAVEAILRRSPSVADAAVVSFAGRAEQRHIAAFVTLAKGRSATAAELRGFLRQELPDYMVPSVLEILESLPLSPTGKVDRARLHIPAAAHNPTPADPAPASSQRTDAILLTLWQQVLGSTPVNLDDNFFDLGGTSLQLIKVHALLRDALGRDVPLLELFEYPRISALAARLDHPDASRKASSINAADRARRRHAALNRIGPSPPGNTS